LFLNVLAITTIPIYNSREVGGMNRREFVRAASGSVLVLGLGELLASCGGGGGGGGGSQVTATVPATVNLNQIGGVGLKALTIDGRNPTVSASGTFSQVASIIQAQLHLLVDSSGAVRSLSTTLGPGTTSVQHNASSTALGLVFLTTGIMTLDPMQASSRTAQVQALAGFGPLTSYLATKLSNSSLNSLGADAQLLALLGEAIADYFAANPLVKTALASSESTLSASWQGTSVVIVNSGWRFVQVLREDQDSTGAQLTDFDPDDSGFIPAGGIVPGITGLSLGNIMHGTVGNPGQLSDGGNFTSNAELAEVTYWVNGIGKASGQSPPSPLQFTQFAAVQTVIYYVVLPVVDIISGIYSNFPGGAAKLVGDTSSKIGTLGAWLSLEQAASAGDLQAFSAALEDLLLAIAGLIAEVIALFLEGSVAAALAEIAGALLAMFAVGFAGFNLGNLINTWFKCQNVTAINVSVSSISVGVQ
jgi:hypothetical protein